MPTFDIPATGEYDTRFTGTRNSLLSIPAFTQTSATTEMFEQQIDETISLILKRTIADRSSIIFRDVLSADIPDSVKRFFANEVDEWMVEEKERLRTSPHFQYIDPQALDQFDDILARTRDYAFFTRDEFSTSLDQTVKLLFNFVCRPQYTLAKYIFSDAETASAQSIIQSLENFLDYEYYRVIFGEYLRKKDYPTLRKDRFEELLAMIDSEVIRGFDSRKMAQLTTPIFALFNLNDDIEFARIPLEALSIFYDDKKITPIVDRLEEEKQRASTISIHELTMLLGEVDYSAGLEISELVNRHVIGIDRGMTESPEEAIMMESMEAFEAVPVPMDESALSVSTTDEGSGFSFSDTLESEETETISAGEQLTPDFDELEAATIEDALPAEEIAIPDDVFIHEESREDTGPDAGLDVALVDEAEEAAPQDEFLSGLDMTVNDARTLPDQIELPSITISDAAPQSESIPINSGDDRTSAGAPIVSAPVVSPPVHHFVEAMPVHEVLSKFGDLRASIPQSERKRYVKRLFRRDEEAYEKAIDVLNGKSSWREASEQIDEIFLNNDVDMYSRIAVQFTDEIYKRYLKKKA